MPYGKPSNAGLSGIYAIINKVTGRTYVGKATVTFGERWSSHKSLLRSRRHRNKDLQTDWIEYGEQAFEFSILEVIRWDQPDAFCTERERFHGETRASLYNIRPLFWR